jgi:pyruvate/2-oxoglutarate dehydrogenase complex dihydrolipoamide dehydrogenase (E3) component
MGYEACGFACWECGYSAEMAAAGRIEGTAASSVGGPENVIKTDIVVLGVGSAGEVVARLSARAGLRVVAVESGLVGGQCPFHACIPSKSLLGSAARNIDWSEAVRRRDEHARHWQDRRAAEELRASGVLLLRGRGRVLGPGRLTVEPQGGTSHPVEVRFDQLVLATGSSPVVPDLPGLAADAVWTSDQALVHAELPPRLVILGGGPAGCELAQLYARFGSEVILVEAALRLLPSEPGFVGALLSQALTADGVRIRLGVKAERLEGPRNEGSGAAASGVLVGLSGGSVVATDRVLVAVGRRPNLAGIGLERLGIDPGDGLTLDRHGQVCPGVWAVGDVVGIAPYTHAATHTARVVADNLLGRPRRLDLSAVPRAVYTDPAVLSVGITAEQVEAEGRSLLRRGFDLVHTARAYLDSTSSGRVEVYADPDSGQVRGVAAIAPRADDWMGQAVLAVRAGLDVRLWEDVIQPFPTFSEAFAPPLRELVEDLGGVRTSSRDSRPG